MSHLSKSQARVLALWSFSMVITRNSSVSAASMMLSALVRQPENTVRQRLREWYWDAVDKKGAKRQEVKVETSFVPLLNWILSKWQWHRTRMTDPQRAVRLWLVVALATLWLLSVGGYAEQSILLATVPDLTDIQPLSKARQVSIFRRGWTLILAALITQSPLPLGYFIPEPWPDDPLLLDLSLFNVHQFVT